jgi:hypothetical protein
MEMTNMHILKAGLDYRKAEECRMVQAVIKIADEILMGKKNALPIPE